MELTTHVSISVRKFFEAGYLDSGGVTMRHKAAQFRGGGREGFATPINQCEGTIFHLKNWIQAFQIPTVITDENHRVCCSIRCICIVYMHKI